MHKTRVRRVMPHAYEGRVTHGSEVRGLREGLGDLVQFVLGVTQREVRRADLEVRARVRMLH